MQLTEVQGGIYTLSWSRENDRVVFSAFTEGGWDVFVAKQPLSIDAVVDQLIQENPQSVFTPRGDAAAARSEAAQDDRAEPRRAGAGLGRIRRSIPRRDSGSNGTPIPCSTR